MRTKVLIFGSLFLFGLVSCNMNKTGPGVDKFEEEYNQEEVEEKPKEAEKKPAIFYQRLLEQFCQKYYNGCFSRREYHSGSLIVDEVSVIQGNWEDGNVVSWNMKVKGKHSFEGMVKNHNDSPFTAFVDDLGNNTYKVTFFIKRYDMFGDQMKEEEEATRTIEYSE